MKLFFLLMGGLEFWKLWHYFSLQSLFYRYMKMISAELYLLNFLLLTFFERKERKRKKERKEKERRLWGGVTLLQGYTCIKFMQLKLPMRSLLLSSNLLYFVIWSWKKSRKSVSFLFTERPIPTTSTGLHPSTPRSTYTPKSNTHTPRFTSDSE